MNIKEAFANMSEEFKKKAAACKDFDEFQALIKAENIELTPEQVEALSGGGDCHCVDYDSIFDKCRYHGF